MRTFQLFFISFETNMMTEEPGQCVHINSFFCVGEDLWHQKERSVLAQNLHSKLPTKKDCIHFVGEPYFWIYRVQLTGTTNETWNIKKPVHIKAPFILRGKVVRTTSSKRWRHSLVEAWEGTNSSCRAIFLMAHVMWKPRCLPRLVSTGIAPKNASFIISLKQSHDLC